MAYLLVCCLFSSTLALLESALGMAALLMSRYATRSWLNVGLLAALDGTAAARMHQAPDCWSVQEQPVVAESRSAASSYPTGSVVGAMAGHACDTAVACSHPQMFSSRKRST